MSRNYLANKPPLAKLLDFKAMGGYNLRIKLIIVGFTDLLFADHDIGYRDI